VAAWVGLTISQLPPDVVLAIALKLRLPELAVTVKLQFPDPHEADACPEPAENEIDAGAPSRVGTAFTVKLTVTCTCGHELGATQLIVSVPE
jgi:hypothetical protein